MFSIKTIGMKKIYFLYGSDCSAIDIRVNELKNQTGNAGKALKLHILSNLEEVELLLNQSFNLNLFGNSLLEIIKINLKIFNHLEKKLDKFIDFLKSFSSDKLVIISLNIEKTDKYTKEKISASVLLKQLKDIAVLEEFNKLMPWQGVQIKEKIIKSSQKYNLKFDDKALNLYGEHVKENLNDLELELKIIQLYLLPDNLVSKKCVADLFSPDINIDDLYEAIIFNKPNSLLYSSVLLQKYDSSLYIIAALQNKFRQALSIKSKLNPNISIYQLSQILGINSYKLEKDIEKLKNISTEFLIFCISKLSDIELKVKTGFINNKHLTDLISIQCAQKP